MNRLRDYFLKDDVSAEKLVDLHRRQDIQEASLRLWLRNDSGKKCIMYYMKLLRTFLC
jgi:hypothetical protein